MPCTLSRGWILSYTKYKFSECYSEINTNSRSAILKKYDFYGIAFLKKLLFREQHAFEHYLFYELNSYKQLNDLDFPIRNWRTKSGIEVDFILGDGSIAIESKMSTLIQKRDVKGLIAFQKERPDTKLYVVCLETRARLMTVDGTHIHIIPIKTFLEDLWDKKII